MPLVSLMFSFPYLYFVNFSINNSICSYRYKKMDWKNPFFSGSLRHYTPNDLPDTSRRLNIHLFFFKQFIIYIGLCETTNTK